MWPVAMVVRRRGVVARGYCAGVVARRLSRRRLAPQHVLIRPLSDQQVDQDRARIKAMMAAAAEAAKVASPEELAAEEAEAAAGQATETEAAAAETFGKVRTAKKKRRQRPDRDKVAVSIHEALDRVLLYATETKPRTFDEALELNLQLSLDPRKPQQQIKTAVELPHGSGKKKTVCAFINENEENPEWRLAAEQAGADVIGGETLVSDVAKGKFNFTAVVATAKMVNECRKAARVLGPRGLLPGPKAPGTVAHSPAELADHISAVKKGARITLKTEKLVGLVSNIFGRVSYGKAKLLENLRAVMLGLQAAKPEKAPKGKFLVDAHISSTMGPSVRILIPSIDPSKPQFLRADVAQETKKTPTTPVPPAPAGPTKNQKQQPDPEDDVAIAA